MKKIFVFFGLLLALAACKPSTPKVNESEVQFNAEIMPYEGGMSSAMEWNGGESVCIQVEDIENPGEWGEIKGYVADGGKLTSEEPFIMAEDEGRKIVRAWTSDGTSADFPTEWAVGEDQSSGSESLSRNDFLYAVSTMGYGEDGNLSFYPQTARIIVNVLQNEYVAEASQIVSLALGDGDIAVSGAWTAPESGLNTGEWTVEGGNATISPLKLASPSSGSVATYRATVVPQNMEGKNLIVLTLDNGVVTSYVPVAGDAAAVIEAGHEYVCDVTVDGEDYALTVTVSEGGAWTDGGSTDIDSEPLNYKKYGPEDTEPKVGDYFYSDGSWSDGGLRRVYYADGTMVWDDVKPEPSLVNPDTQQSRSIIGIIFTTDTDRMGEAEKQALSGMGTEPHGLVISTSAANYGNGYAWCLYPVDETEIGIPNVMDYVSCNADINGYYYNQQIRSGRDTDYSLGLYPAFMAAEDFAEEAAGPAEGTKTTGWYLPSVGQWFDVLRNLGGINVDDGDGSYMVMSSTDFMWMDVGDVPQALNDMMENVPDESKVLYNAGDVWTSSAVSQSHARSLFLDNFGFLRGSAKSKTSSSGQVRCVLAF